MLIEICEDIVSAAEKNKRSAIFVLEKLSLAYKYGKHIIYASFPLLNRIVKIQGLNRTVRNLYSDLKSKNTFLGSLFNRIDSKVKITYTTTSHREQNLIFINPDEHESFEFYEETHLLVENLIDSRFYSFCVDFYKRQNSIICNNLFYPLQGGGDPMDKVYELETNLKQHFCIAIADSDKSYPTANIGQTADNIFKMDKKHKPFNCILYIMKDLREIENMIPFNIIKTDSNYKNNEIISKQLLFNFSYFDFKEGIGTIKMFTQDYFNYWKNNISSNNIQFIDKFSEIEDSKIYLTKKEFEDYWRKDYLIGGFGKNLLEYCIKKHINNFQTVTTQDLTTEQINEWTTIGKILFEWSCSTNKNFV